MCSTNGIFAFYICDHFPSSCVMVNKLTEKTILDSKYKAMLLLPLFSAQSHGVCFCAFSENNGASRKTSNCNVTIIVHVFSVKREILLDDYSCCTFTFHLTLHLSLFPQMILFSSCTLITVQHRFSCTFRHTIYKNINHHFKFKTEL